MRLRGQEKGVCPPPCSNLRFQIERQVLLEHFPLCLVPLIFLPAEGATVGAKPATEFVIADSTDSRDRLFRRSPFTEPACTKRSHFAALAMLSAN